MNVTIRPLQEQDAYTSVKWRNDPEVFKYTGNTYKNEILLKTELAWIKKVMHNENEYRCAILVEETYVGNIYLTDIAEGKANYHIFIGNKDFWGKGIAKKASELIIKYAFETLQLNEIHLRVKKLNDRALNLYKSLGFSVDSEDDEWISMSKYRVMVSIRCLVYNHEPYLRQCLDGFVMQKTSFKFEAIIHDDASTDGSAAIIKEYAEKYPDIIKPIFETENQYSKHDGSLSRIMNAAMRGKYIAFCEGDDYWTDPLKLQKQVDALEAHPECSFSAHYVQVISEKGLKLNRQIPTQNQFNSGIVDRKIIVKTSIEGCKYSLQTCSLFIRNSVLKKNQSFYSIPGNGDEKILRMSLSEGHLFFIPNIMSCYRYQSVGSWNSRTKKDSKIRIKSCQDLKLLNSYFDKYTNYSFHENIEAAQKNIDIIILLKKRELRNIFSVEYKDYAKRFLSKKTFIRLHILSFFPKPIINLYYALSNFYSRLKD